MIHFGDLHVNSFYGFVGLYTGSNHLKTILMVIDVIGLPWEERLREAAKQRLRRLCAAKRKRKDLEVPEWVRDEFAARNKNDLADLLMDCNWDKARSNHVQRLFYSTFCMYSHDLKFVSHIFPSIPMLQNAFLLQLEIVVKKKASVKVTRDWQWVSEKEMRDDLGWSACHVTIMVSGLYVFTSFLSGSMFQSVHLCFSSEYTSSSGPALLAQRNCVRPRGPRTSGVEIVETNWV